MIDISYTLEARQWSPAGSPDGSTRAQSGSKSGMVTWSGQEIEIVAVVRFMEGRRCVRSFKAIPSPSTPPPPPPPPPPAKTPPDHGNSQYTHKSSPRRTIPYHAEQIRDEIAWANAMNLTIRMKTATEMRKALAAGGEIPRKPPRLQLGLNFGTFTQDSNNLSEFVRNNCKHLHSYRHTALTGVQTVSRSSSFSCIRRV